MIELARYRSRSPATPDLLNWAASIDDGVVLNKDGSLTAGWYYRGADLSTATAAERNQASAVVNAALAGLGSEWMMHVDAGREEADGYPKREDSAFPDPVTALIDEERRAYFEAAAGHYETTHALTVTYLPPKIGRARAAEMVFSDVSEGSARQRGAADAALAHFRSALLELEDRLSSVLELQRMTGVPYQDAAGRVHVADRLLGHLRWTLTGVAGPVNLPPVPMYLDALIGAVELWTGVIPRVGDRYVMCVAIDGFPGETAPGILAELDQLPVSYRWSTRFIFSDAIEAQAELRGYRRRWQQRVRGFWDQAINRAPATGSAVNADAQEMVGETDAALAEASSGLVGYGAYTSVVVLSDEDRGRVEAAARLVRRALVNLGFGARIETVNTVEAWLGSLPGHAIQNVRRPLLHSLHLANLLPLGSVWPGAPTAPCPMYPPGSPALVYATSGSTPFRLNLHVGDVGHTVVFGPTGTGKSTLLGLLAAQFRRYPGATVYAFEAGGSMEVLTRAVGGSHFDVGSEGMSFAPLSQLDRPGELAWAADWVEMLIGLQGAKLSPAQRNELTGALERVARQKEKTLTALQIEVQDREVKNALQEYTVDGQHGELVDAAEDGLEIGDWACFELGEVMGRQDRIKLPVLLYLFHVISRRTKGQPCLLVLDEAWMMLGHEVFRERIREWLVTLRKANVAVVLATQSVSDARRSGMLDVLTESCKTRIFLANPEAEEAEPAALYRAFGLYEAELEIVRGLVPKREYYFRGEGRRAISLALGPAALAFVGASSPEERRAVRRLERIGGDWQHEWLRERGVEYAGILG